MSQGIREGYKIIGSADFLGNPVGLVGSIGSGVEDFFYAPMEGIVRSPAAFGRGLATGTVSLLANTVSGVGKSASKITGAAGRGLTALSGDRQFAESRRRDARTRVDNPLEGFALGMKSFARGVGSGVAGIVTQPLEGGREDGIAGVGRGLAQGLVGVVAKPAAGVLGLVENTTRGFAALAGITDATRVRAPRVFEAESAVRGYDAKASAGHMALRSVQLDSAVDSVRVYRRLSKERELVGTLRLVAVTRAGDREALMVARVRAIDAVELTDAGVRLRMHSGKDFLVALESADEAVVVHTQLTALVRAYVAARAGDLDENDPLAATAEATLAADDDEIEAEAVQKDVIDNVVSFFNKSQAPAATTRLRIEAMPRKAWVPDGASPTCMLCMNEWSGRRTRHHCRLCGKLVCDTCSRSRVALTKKGLFESTVEEERMCDECAAAL